MTRDRRGRGLRGVLASKPVPIAHSRGDAFDALVLQAAEHLRPQLGDELARVEFAVEDVPTVSHHGPADFDYDDDVLDDNAIPLSRIYRNGVAGLNTPVIVLYRRPIETRAKRLEDLADLVHDVVVEQVARLLGRPADEIDPPAE
jgi:predicted Zn-dependent protease with MMP-like domain